MESLEHATEAHIDSLISSGLLSAVPKSVASSFSSFLSTFHAANVDYPFFDYGSPSVVKDESQLLDHYASLWSPPPPILTRAGPRYALPGADLDLAREPERAGLTPLSLAWLLRTALAPIGEIPTRYVTCVRRTTPSGGSRHPTELAVILRRPLGEIPAGTFTYDIVSHTLVREEAEAHEEYAAALADRDFGFLVRSRVERAMWRYRDLRALRPMLIDAGHVVELVAFLLGRLGVSTEVVSPPVAPVRPSWLEEPEVALLRPTHIGTADMLSHSSLRLRPIQTVDREEAYLTNPALVLRFGPTMYAGALWPSPKHVAIDLADFLILNHCIPSTRGDRDQSADGIMAAVPDASTRVIERLRDHGALLPNRDAQKLYVGSRLWVRHEWYMALLVHLETLGHGVDRPVASRIRSDSTCISDLATVFRRRTSRVFPPSPLSADSVEKLLSRVFQNAWHPGLEVSVVAWNVLGLAPGLYRWQAAQLERVAEAPERDVIAANSAGQSAASTGALSIWISSLTDVERPERYLMDLVDLGRLGQRMCMVATELGMATFLTPAVYDRGTCSSLSIGAADRRLTYVFGLGAPMPLVRRADQGVRARTTSAP